MNPYYLVVLLVFGLVLVSDSQLNNVDIPFLSKLKFELRARPKQIQCIYYLRAIEAKIKGVEHEVGSEQDIERSQEKANVGLLVQVRDHLNHINTLAKKSLVSYLNECIKTLEEQKIESKEVIELSEPTKVAEDGGKDELLIALEELQRKLDNTEEEAKRLREEREKFNKLEIERKELSEKNETNLKKLEQLHIDNAERRNSQVREKNNLLAKYEASKRELEQVKAQMKNLAEVSENLAQMAAKEQEADRVDQKNVQNELQKRVDEEKNRLALLENENDVLKVKLAETEAKLKAAQLPVGGGCQKESDELESIKSKNSRLEEAQKKSLKQLEIAKFAASSLKDRLDKAATVHDNLVQKHNSTQGELSNTRAELERVKQRNSETEAEYKRIQDSLAEKLVKAREELTALRRNKSETKALEDQVRELKRQLINYQNSEANSILLFGGSPVKSAQNVELNECKKQLNKLEKELEQLKYAKSRCESNVGQEKVKSFNMFTDTLHDTFQGSQHRLNSLW